MKVLFAGPDPDLVMTNSGHDRQAGLHLSDITKRMAFEKDKKLNPNNPIDAMVLERGFTWETVLETALSARNSRAGYRPEQLQDDTYGIWMSPDWVDPEGDIQLEEWKATKKSCKRGFADVSWHWLPNTMIYLRELLRRKLVSRVAARFRIWWMNGDYSYESKTSDYLLLNDYWKVDVEFDKRELEENWQKVLTNGQRFGLLKKAPTEESWQKRKPEPTTPTPRKKVGSPPPASREKARVVTFPTGQKSKRRSAGS